jgi:protein TonB
LTLPKPIATPAPKLDEPLSPPDPAAAPPAPRETPPPVVPRITSPPVAEPTPPVQAAPPGPSPALSSTTTRSPGPIGVTSPVTSTPSTARAPEAGVSLVQSDLPGSGVASIRGDGGVTQVARPTGGYQVRPSYPSTARRLGVQGTTLLRVHVLDDGRVGEVDVEQSAGHPDLDRAAADAVRRWRFEPARRGEQAVAMWVRLPVEFRLK